MIGIAPARFPAFLLIALTAVPLLASNSVIRFDLPPTVAAKPTDPAGRDHNLVACQFRVSSLIAAPAPPQIDQWLVVCQPRDAAMEIVDYSPRTDAQSDIEGPIDVKATSESSASMGLSLDGNYGGVARANIGADKGNKRIDWRQYSLTPQQQAVTASGTINRGRGVYFKLRRSPTQILEGEKTFELIFRIHDQWRGSLIDVSILAQSERSALAGFDKRIKTMGQSNFVVAVYRDGDAEAARISRRLADAEQSLRELARQRENRSKSTTWSAMLTRMAIVLDLQSPQPNDRWVWRLLAGEADPYLDKEIQRLPMNVRLAVLDYCEIREDFDRLAHSPTVEASDRLASRTRAMQDNAD